MKQYRIYFCLIFSLAILTTNLCQAQATDSTRINPSGTTFRNAPKNETNRTILKKEPWQPDPKKAGLYATLIPGLGQVYNRQYWKLPIVYAGLGVAGYFIVRNTKEYNKYRKAYIGRLNNDYPTDEFVGIYSVDQLKQIQSDYNKNLSMTILFSSLAYMMQIMDAVTAAHLRNFDISRDISMQMRPVITPIGGRIGGGMGLVMNFK